MMIEQTKQTLTKEKRRAYWAEYYLKYKEGILAKNRAWASSEKGKQLRRACRQSKRRAI